MEIDELKSNLSLLTYPAQFESSLSIGIPAVLVSVVEFGYPLKQEYYYLRVMQEIVENECDLSDIVPSVKGRTNEEIRQFLIELAATIERRYGNFARAGQMVSVGGQWRKLETSDEMVLSAGERLPSSGAGSIWKRVLPTQQKSAWEAVRDELCTYYSKGFVKFAEKFEDPARYAKPAVERVKKEVRPSEVENIAEVLLKIAQENDAEILNELNDRSGGVWRGEKSLGWLKGLALCMKENLQD